MQHTVKGATDAAIIAAFNTNVRDVKMRKKLSTRTLTKASELYAVADKRARIKEGRRLPGEPVPEKETVDKKKNQKQLPK